MARAKLRVTGSGPPRVDCSIIVWVRVFMFRGRLASRGAASRADGRDVHDARGLTRGHLDGVS